MNQLRIVICSGPTREWLDPVRYITNPSTGETGFHLAKVAQQHAICKELIYIAGHVSPAYQTLPKAICKQVSCTEEMAQAVQHSIQDHTILFMVAAPADFRPAKKECHKIKKTQKDCLHLTMEPTIDILKSLIPYKSRYNFYVIGFAAETKNMKAYALKKLTEKNMNLICANEVYYQRKGFGHHDNLITVYDANEGEKKIGPLPKADLAHELFHYTLQKLQLLQQVQEAKTTT